MKRAPDICPLSFFFAPLSLIPSALKNQFYNLRMAGDHHYTAPKTDGTFGLKVNWTQLAKKALSTSASSTSTASPALPFKPTAPIQWQELETKTIRQWLNWRSWRSESPWSQQLSVRGQFKNYMATYYQGGWPTRGAVLHLIVGLVGVGFVVSYPKTSNHLHAKHH